jgi:ankyrin repeat protein
MSLFRHNVKSLIENKDFSQMELLLNSNPELANKPITIPYEHFCIVKAHPLHRICDAVFTGHLTDDDAIKFAKIFLTHGANIDGDKAKGGGTPLLAAASLHAEKLGIFYIDNGADVHYVYEQDGASALHWASFCGRNKLVEKLINAGVSINIIDIEHQSTPLAWAIHALMTNDENNLLNQIACIKLLLIAGADRSKLSKAFNDYLLNLANDDAELLELIV